MSDSPAPPTDVETGRRLRNVTGDAVARPMLYDWVLAIARVDWSPRHRQSIVLRIVIATVITTDPCVVGPWRYGTSSSCGHCYGWRSSGAYRCSGGSATLDREMLG